MLSRRSPSRRCSSWRLAGHFARRRRRRRRRRDRTRHRLVFRDVDRFTVMCDFEWGSFAKRVASLLGLDLDLQPAPAKAETEGQATQALRQPGGEGQQTVVVAHAAEAARGLARRGSPVRNWRGVACDRLARRGGSGRAGGRSSPCLRRGARSRRDRKDMAAAPASPCNELTARPSSALARVVRTPTSLAPSALDNFKRFFQPTFSTTNRQPLEAARRGDWNAC